jgi:hypothetical protein
VVFVVLARSGHTRATEDPVQASAARTQEIAESRMRVGNVLLIAGGVLAATGIVWFALGSKEQNANVAVGPSSVWLSVRF